MTPTNETAPSLLRPCAVFGRWWWRRWSRPRNAYLASASVVVWIAALVLGLWFRGWILASTEPDVIEHRDEVLPFLTWLLLASVSSIYLSLAFAMRARATHLAGWRRQGFLVLTVAGNGVMLFDTIYFLAVVH